MAPPIEMTRSRRLISITSWANRVRIPTRSGDVITPRTDPYVRNLTGRADDRRRARTPLFRLCGPKVWTRGKSVDGTKLTFRLTLDSRGDKASPRRRGTSATGGAWHGGAAPGSCRANRVATPRYSGDQPIDPHSDADAPPNVQHPEDMADRPARCRALQPSYSTGQLATGRLRNLTSSVRCCLPVMRRRLDRTNAVRHFLLINVRSELATS
jgi:hypothetical protein